MMKVYDTDKDLTADHAMNCCFHILFVHLSALKRFETAWRILWGKRRGIWAASA